MVDNMGRLVIQIDRELCMGSGSCAFQAPNTFDLDDGARVVLLPGPMDDPALVRAAVRACPTDALQLLEGDPMSYSQPDLSLFGEEHIRRYRETDGAVGHLWNGASCLLLTTTGRRSHVPRTSPLIYGVDGDSFVVVASRGGAPQHPAWYHNLSADPHVEVQVKADRFAATARTAEGEERDRLWNVMTTVWPNYDEYTKRTDRRIPVVVLERDPS